MINLSTLWRMLLNSFFFLVSLLFLFECPGPKFRQSRCLQFLTRWIYSSQGFSTIFLTQTLALSFSLPFFIHNPDSLVSINVSHAILRNLVSNDLCAYTFILFFLRFSGLREILIFIILINYSMGFAWILIFVSSHWKWLKNTIKN